MCCDQQYIVLGISVLSVGLSARKLTGHVTFDLRGKSVHVLHVYFLDETLVDDNP